MYRMYLSTHMTQIELYKFDRKKKYRKQKNVEGAIISASVHPFANTT